MLTFGLILLIVIVAWFSAGYLAVIFINLFILIPIEPYQAGLMSMVIGLIWLAIIRNLETDTRFTEGQRDLRDDGDSCMGMMLLLPLGLVSWLIICYMLLGLWQWFR